MMEVDDTSTPPDPVTPDHPMDSEGIPLDRDSLLQYYHSTPKKSKRGRESAGSSESRQSKIHRRSTSHSTAPTVPSTKISTRTHSLSRDQSKSPIDDNDRRGASRTTGAIIRGNARGNNINMADRGMIYLYNDCSNIYFIP
jgi:hypothetical protein